MRVEQKGHTDVQVAIVNDLSTLWDNNTSSAHTVFEVIVELDKSVSTSFWCAFKFKILQISPTHG